MMRQLKTPGRIGGQIYKGIAKHCFKMSTLANKGLLLY